MRFEGKLHKPKRGEKYWSVEIPDLGIFTQGKNIDDALAMAKDALETAVDEPGFEASVQLGSGMTFYVSANEVRFLTARFLHFYRLRRGMSMREVATRMGSKSQNAYAQYEHGTSCPSIDKLTEILHAMDPEVDFVFKAKKFG